MSAQPVDVLLPCPFCGGAGWREDGMESVRCESCGAWGAMEDPWHPQTAIEAWNQRPRAVAELIEAVSDVYGDDPEDVCGTPCPSCRIRAALARVSGGAA